MRPTAVGAHAPSANRVNVRPARAGAEPELANLGRVSLWGARPIFLFFWGKLVAAEYAFAGVGGHFFCPPRSRAKLEEEEVHYDFLL